MKKQKMNLANIQGKLSREEMKNIMGGDAPIPGEGCYKEYEYDCHKARTPYPCCEGLTCEENATQSGSICMAI